MRAKLHSRKVCDEMTPAPLVVQMEEPIAKAAAVMEARRIRHLPVMSGEKVVGMVSDRDLKASQTSSWWDKFTVMDVMTPDPYLVPSRISLEKVINRMIRDRIGSAIVMGEDGRVAGIFTAVDALRVLRGLLQAETRKRAPSRRRRPRLSA